MRPTAPEPTGRAERAALLGLLATPGLGEQRATLLLRRHGSAQRALRAVRRGEAGWRGRGGAGGHAGLAAGAREERVAHALRACDRLDVHVLACTEARYPALPIEVPPPVLFARGDLALLERPMVAVVGTRACTEYGTDVAAEIGRALARAGVVVVSGLARGIDGAAHEAALAAGGATLAVLGCGIDVCYPPEHRVLQERIAERGLLISQYLPGAPPLPDHFVRRNRIIAGLSRATVVVEGSHRSGSLSTARCALDQGADVFAVPGPVGRVTSEGPLALLRDGAHVYTEPADLLVAIGCAPGAAAESSISGAREPGGMAGARAAGDASPGGADEPVRYAALWSALAREPRHIDAIADHAAASGAEVLACLLELELDGQVEQLPGMRFRRRA